MKNKFLEKTILALSLFLPFGGLDARAQEPSRAQQLSLVYERRLDSHVTNVEEYSAFKRFFVDASNETEQRMRYRTLSELSWHLAPNQEQKKISDDVRDIVKTSFEEALKQTPAYERFVNIGEKTFEKITGIFGIKEKISLEPEFGADIFSPDEIGIPDYEKSYNAKFKFGGLRSALQVRFGNQKEPILMEFRPTKIKIKTERELTDNLRLYVSGNINYGEADLMRGRLSYSDQETWSINAGLYSRKVLGGEFYARAGYSQTQSNRENISTLLVWRKSI